MSLSWRRGGGIAPWIWPGLRRDASAPRQWRRNCSIDIMTGMVSKALQNILERIETWPESAQEEAAATLEAIEEDLVSPHSLSIEDKQALERSADDVRQGRFATEEAVQELFGRFRRR